MTPTELVAAFRADVADVGTPPLWSDDEVWAYLNDAIQKWLEITGGVRDASTASIVELAVTASDPWLELSPLICEIRSARLASTGKTLPILSFEELFGMQGTTNRQFPVSTDDLDEEGAIKALVVGMEDNKLRAVRIPEEADTVKLVVKRLSRFTHAADDTPEDAIEIDAQYHRDLLHGMEWLAYNKQDADTFDPERAARSEARFRLRAAEVREEIKRRERKPRLIAYGGV